jgi:hypothetical protein
VPPESGRGQGHAGPSPTTALSKAYDLTCWTAERVARFPRTHGVTVGQRLVNTLLDAQELLVEAYYSREKRALLRRVNLGLERLRVLFRLAKDLRCLSESQYEFAVRQVDETGRLVGGWLRQQGQRT